MIGVRAGPSRGVSASPNSSCSFTDTADAAIVPYSIVMSRPLGTVRRSGRELAEALPDLPRQLIFGQHHVGEPARRRAATAIDGRAQIDVDAGEAQARSSRRLCVIGLAFEPGLRQHARAIVVARRDRMLAQRDVVVPIDFEALTAPLPRSSSTRTSLRVGDSHSGSIRDARRMIASVVADTRPEVTSSAISQSASCTPLSRPITAP